MSARGDFYAWRLVATGISFTTFGAGGLLLGLLIFPVLNLLPGDRITRGRRTVRRTFRLFIGIMRGLGLLTWELHDGNRLHEPGRLFIANHPSLIDVIFLVALIPDVNCIVKGSLFRNPCMRGAVSGAGYIANDNSVDMIAAAAECLRRGESLIVFPEGTRTLPGQPPLFQRGAAYIALRAGAPICPITIRCTPPTLSKQEKWYQIAPRRVRYTIEVKETVEPAAIIDGTFERPVAARRLTRRLQQYFTQEIAA